MEKVLKIKNCGECSHSWFSDKGVRCRNKDMKLIAKYEKYTGSIPKWCPLPDDKDYTAIANNVKTLIEAQRCEWDGNDYGG